MPKKQNLKLDALKIKSFVTELKEKSAAAKGGAVIAVPDQFLPADDTNFCPTMPSGCTDCTICYPCTY